MGASSARATVTEPTVAGPTVAGPTVAGPRLTESSPDAGADAMALASAIGVADRARTAPAADLTEIGAPSTQNGYGETAKQVVDRSLGHRRWPWVILLVAILLGSGSAVGLAAARHYKVLLFTPTHKVPSLRGVTPAKASSELAAYHFTVRVSGHSYNVGAPFGSILSQSPKPGSILKQGSIVSVVTSAGPPPVVVPDISSITAGGCPAATAVLSTAHLGTVCSSATSITVKAGGVIGYDPTRTAIWGKKVHVVISAGLPDVALPDLAGLTKSAVSAALVRAHFVAAFATPQYSDSVPLGEPISWTGDGSKLLYGSTVTVVMSLGHAPITVPDVSNGSYDVAQAESTLRADGFTIRGVAGPSGPVVYTFPGAGETVAYNTPVEIYTA